MVFKSIAVRYICVVALLLAALCSVCHAEPDFAVGILTDEGREYRVTVQEYNNQRYLLLPSFADPEKLTIHGLNGTLRSGKRSVTCTDGAALDLTALFPGMKAGTAYDAQIVDSTGKQTVIIRKTANMPTIFIELGETENGEAADRAWLDLNKENKVFNSTLSQVSSDGILLCNTAVKQIKGRGNASFYSAVRKAYGIKLEEAFELIENAGESKNWVLVGNDVYDKNAYHDRTGIFNYASRLLYKELNGHFALDVNFYDLYINGEYRGLYMLSEKPEISKTRISIAKTKLSFEDKVSVTRIVGTCGLYLNGQTKWEGYNTKTLRDRMDTDNANVTTVLYTSSEEDRSDAAINAGVRAYQFASESEEENEGGFLLELDFRFGDVTAWFVTRRGVTIAIKEPEFASRKQVQEIAAYVQGFEDALYSSSGYTINGKHFTEYADIDSIVRFSITEMFLANIDTFLSSTFMCIDREDGALQAITFGPVWDNDYCQIGSTYLINGWNAFKLKSKESGFPMVPWLDQFFTKSEFVAQMNKVWLNEFLPAVTKLVDGPLKSFTEQISISLNMTKQITERFDPDLSLKRAGQGIKNRITAYKSLWSKKNLKGVALTQEETQLVAAPDGPYSNVTWYRVNETDYSAEKLSSGKNLKYSPKESGLYFAAVTGPSLLYNPVGSAGTLTEPRRVMTSPVVRFDAQGTQPAQ